MGIGILSWIAYAIWAVSEVMIVMRSSRQRQSLDTTRSDKGSVRVIAITIVMAIAVSFLFHFLKWGWVDPIVAEIGAGVMLLGVGLRVWSFMTLGRNFAPVVETDAAQTLVKSGPYRLIRHPAYTAAIITLTFLGLAFNSWIASVVILFFVVACYVYRIRVEEPALRERFGAEYDDYEKATKRLIPFIW